MAFPPRSTQRIRIDPLLSYCGVEALASRADQWIFMSRSPVAWVESLARKIRFQKLFPLIRSLPILRPPAPRALLRYLKAHLPAEDPYLLGLLAAYVGLHRRVNALAAPMLRAPLQLCYEDLYGAPSSPAWHQAWHSLFDALGWPEACDDKLLSLLQRRSNAAPVRLPSAIRDPQRVTSIVQALINHNPASAFDV